jgi:hypothetical protein
VVAGEKKLLTICCDTVHVFELREIHAVAVGGAPGQPER